MAEPSDPQRIIAFQGVAGAYSDMACRAAYPHWTTLPCASFEDTFASVRHGLAGLAMIPIENSSAGRVADIHHLLPESGLHIIAEHFQKVNHQLLAPASATLETLQTVRSHVQALSQCRPRAPSPRPWPASSTGSRCCCPTLRTPSTTPPAS
jgi:prephenate dehydratase